MPWPLAKSERADRKEERWMIWTVVAKGDTFIQATDLHLLKRRFGFRAQSLAAETGCCKQDCRSTIPTEDFWWCGSVP